MASTSHVDIVVKLSWSVWLGEVVEVMMGGQRSIFEKTLDAFESTVARIALDAIDKGCHVCSFCHHCSEIFLGIVTQVARALD